jgi:hypothetical protein
VPAPPQPTLPDPCQDFSNQPILTLSLSPTEIYREDSITATWEVRDRRHEIQWGYPVHIETFGPRPAFPDPAPRTGSHTYTTPAVNGRVTLRTRCGEKQVNWEQIPDAGLEAVEPERGAVGTTVRLRGSQFGERQGQSRVEIIAGGVTRTMAVTSWGNVRIEATVPNGVPTGQAAIRVVKGGRRETRTQNFRVVRTVTIDTALARGAADVAGLSATQILLTNGQNASRVTLGGGLAAFSFTVPNGEWDVPAGAQIAQNILLPGSGFPERIRYRVRDVRSNTVNVSIAGGQIVLSVGFESSGSEVKGDVYYCDVGVRGACISHSWHDSLAPDIQVNQARVTLRLTPGASGGNLTFPSATDAFEADVRIGAGIADWLQPLLRGYAEDIKRTIGTGVHAALNTAAIRNAAATAVMASLRNLGVQNIVSVTPAGNQITVEYE